MQVRTRMCTSLDGYISNADGLPVQLSDPEFDPEAYGFVELQANSDAVLMGITTLVPALDRRPMAVVGRRRVRPRLRSGRRDSR